VLEVFVSTIREGEKHILRAPKGRPFQWGRTERQIA
jgi:hypothetical protein